MTKKLLHAIAAAAFFAALAIVYFFFPATAKRVFQNGTAVMMQSWNDTFHGVRGHPTLTIDLAASNTKDGGDVASGTDAGAAGAEEPASSTEAATTVPPAESSTTPAVADGISVLAATTTDIFAANDMVVSAKTSVLPSPQSAASSTSAPQECSISVSTTLSRKIIFNEIAWMGSPPRTGETGAAASNREWIELKNITNGPLNIARWQVLDAAGKIKIVLGDMNVPAGGFYLLARGADYAGALTNTGDVLAIVDDGCNASDVLDASSGWPAGNNETKQTLERDGSGTGWHTSVSPGGTPGTANSVVMPGGAGAQSSAASASGGNGSGSATVADAAPAATGASSTSATSTSASPPCPSALDHLVIAEIRIAGTSSTNDFIKIFNPTAAAADVSGWKLRKKSKTGAEYSLRVFPNGSLVASGGNFLWANADDGFGDAIHADATSTATLAADNSAALFDASNATIDAVAWGEGTDQYVEGTAYPANPEAGQTLKRKFLNDAIVDTGNNADDFAI